MITTRQRKIYHMEYRYEDYGMTPEQFHSGVSKLWNALDCGTNPGSDVFTLASKFISENRSLQIVVDGVVRGRYTNANAMAVHFAEFIKECDKMREELDLSIGVSKSEETSTKVR